MSVQIQINGENAAETVKELTSLASHFMHVPVTAPAISVAPAGAPAQQPTQAQNVAPYTQPPYQPEQAQHAVPAVPVAPPMQSAPEATPQAPPTPVPSVAPTPPSGAVPTTAQSYTIDQLAVAATQLVDAGRQGEVVQMLQQFGGPPLTAVPKEHYGAVATHLRALGAKI